MPRKAASKDDNQIEAARRLMACAQIESIRLTQGTINHAAIAPELRKEPLTVHISTRANGSFTSDHRLHIIAAFDLKAQRPSQSRTEVHLSAKFELLYKLPTEVQPSEEEMAAFAGTNAILNSWPYWREFVQSGVARIGLPPLTLPLFRLVGGLGTAAKRRSAKK